MIALEEHVLLNIIQNNLEKDSPTLVPPSVPR